MGADQKLLHANGAVDLSFVGWKKSAKPNSAAEFSTLSQRISTDVIIVGGGIMGTSLALHLREHGISTALLEAREIGFGASGRNGGDVSTHFEGPGPVDAAIKKLPDRGEKFFSALRGGPAAVEKLLSKYHIECNYTSTGHYALAAKNNHLKTLKEKQRYWDRVGISMDILDGNETAAIMGSRRFLASLKEGTGGRINSFAYTNGLATAAANLQARIYTNSPVRKIERRGNYWHACTDHAEVQGNTIVICTNGYSSESIPAVSKSFYPFLLGAANLQPLPESFRSSVIPSGGVISQIGLPASIQMDITGRFYISGAVSPFSPHASALLFSKLTNWIREAFPQIAAAPLQPESYWTGWEAFTADSLPRIYNPEPGFYAPMCFNGLGITTCTQFGVALAHAIAKNDFRDLPVPLSKPSRFPGRTIYRLAAGLLMTSMFRLSSI